MANFDNLNNSIATLKTDAEALIALQGEDPTIQAKINEAQASVDAIDAEVKAKLGQ